MMLFFFLTSSPFNNILLISIFHFFSLSQGLNHLQLLLNLKTAMIGSQASHALQDWISNNPSSSSSSSFCSFSGVTCNNNQSRVTSLNITNLPLFGHLPPQIGSFTNLVNLTIAGNNLTGTLPAEMAKLTSLKILNISNNLFSGNFPGEIIRAMTELQVLDIYNNNFTGTLPTEIIGLKKLTHLGLGGNYFSGNIPENYSEIQSLKYLGLNGNSLTGNFPKSLGKLRNLEVMYVGHDNNYNGGIPPELGRMISLKILDMSNCNLTGNIPEELSQLKNLQSLFLWKNNLTGEIPPELGDLVSIQHIDLSINKLSGIIPSIGIFNLPNVTITELNDNHLSGDLPSQISGDSLGILVLSNNLISGKISAGISNLKNLHTLLIEHNRFDGEIPSEIFTKLNLLQRINFSSNHLSGEIPVSMFRSSSLTSIDLSQNSLSGEIPKEIADVKDLSTLNISHNNLTGQIPTTSSQIIFKSYLLTLTLIGVSALLSIMGILLITIIVLRHKLKNNKPRPWKLTTFAKSLNFNAAEVIECVKEENIVGRGGAGIVYRGSMRDGCLVAIKQCRVIGGRDGGFSAEIKTLGQIRHRYIVRLLGYVSNKETNLLLYEFMENGSLGEYTHTLKVDEKSDVYSFGVVLLELVTGKKPVGDELFEVGMNIVGWVREIVSDHSQQHSDYHETVVLAIMDPLLLNGDYPIASVIHIFRVAIICVSDDASTRPTMREVVYMLTNIASFSTSQNTTH
ncbi:hypothetical protein G4B88_029747 [Cannabis sativa]|uniref:Protein kinase domain-containing protein n=1 Tax=Cannabis sativa TaxID=3483 RepID=A0A7J6GEX5_CANSA|nr:hypothetical protein G4B88_029747 [Cannabis sativa]